MKDCAAESGQSALLGRLQARFPLCPQPFAELGRGLGMNEDRVLTETGDLKSQGILRRISPVLDARKLGYQTTLVAMTVAEADLGKAEKAVRSHPGVGHAYLREHRYNLWVTLAVAPGAQVSAELKKLATETGAAEVFDLPALKVFKLRAYFGSELDDSTPASGAGGLSAPVELDELERTVLNVLQQDLPVESRPFDGMAGQTSSSTEEFLDVCRSLTEKGVIRRYGAAINHRRAGFLANAMCCWSLPTEQAESLGRTLAGLKSVSHCYIRQTNPLWRYNLFAMVHGRSRAECESRVRSAGEGLDLSGPLFLYSTREFKKIRVEYRV
jgi:DNA-binding Lrp family transcriptional regulator